MKVNDKAPKSKSVFLIELLVLIILNVMLAMRISEFYNNKIKFVLILICIAISVIVLIIAIIQFIRKF